MLIPARRTLLLFFAFLLFHAAEGAAFYRWIHELSGPRNFKGFSMYSLTNFDGGITEWGGAGFLQVREQEYDRRFWLRATGAITWSNDEERAASRVYWLAAEPTLEARILNGGQRYLVYSGAGVSMSRFLGTGFQDFWEFSWKVTPIAFNWNISGQWILKARVELDRFVSAPTPGDFGLSAVSPTNSEGEWVSGVSVAIVLPFLNFKKP